MVSSSPASAALPPVVGGGDPATGADAVVVGAGEGVPSPAASRRTTAAADGTPSPAPTTTASAPVAGSPPGTRGGRAAEAEELVGGLP